MSLTSKTVSNMDKHPKIKNIIMRHIGNTNPNFFSTISSFKT